MTDEQQDERQPDEEPRERQDELTDEDLGGVAGGLSAPGGSQAGGNIFDATRLPNPDGSGISGLRPLG